MLYFKSARCARASASQRPKWSPTGRADQPRHLPWLTPTRGSKAGKRRFRLCREVTSAAGG